LSGKLEGKELFERPNSGQENTAEMYVNNNCVIVDWIELSLDIVNLGHPESKLRNVWGIQHKLSCLAAC